MIDLIELRHTLHRFPELSGQEHKTAKRMAVELRKLKPTTLIENVGGTGLIAVFDSGAAGDTMMIRCELDALPIQETREIPYKSTISGKGHLCGHDGHMTILIGLAQRLSETPIKQGKALLLFQPAEETGAGARAVIDDPTFAALKPDFSYALHNLPGMAKGEVGIKAGPFNFASCGLAIELTGRTAHASHPEDAVSPTQTVADLLVALPQIVDKSGQNPAHALITICHAQIGEAAFGITPGNARIFATLRSINDETQEVLVEQCEQLAIELAARDGLEVSFKISESFAACDNDPVAANNIKTAASDLGLATHELEKPFRWSEDFGLFGSVSNSALFVLGAGEETPQLHAPDYDFPDELIETGVNLFETVVRGHCG